MTERLYKGMFSNDQSDLFDLHDGQMRAYGKLVHNGYWYNLRGESLGMGDLSVDDMETVALSLEDGEVFVVLREGASCELNERWHWYYNNLREGVLDNPCYVIVPNVVYRVNVWDVMDGECRMTEEVCMQTNTALPVTMMSRGATKKLIASFASSADATV